MLCPGRRFPAGTFFTAGVFREEGDAAPEIPAPLAPGAEFYGAVASNGFAFPGKRCIRKTRKALS
ncbi:hypothetical protein KL86DPRO_70046 [uncultured delta proteobacterium]|uniref:Uncharacterized protein n=1 Tax=uncultured delta proteobacterium TaxID=34034 RepID=A0A212KGH4_9DELT|nr:hypothetical protein KL86DPRO_70046 [uncultured delta proteobacterium]